MAGTIPVAFAVGGVPEILMRSNAYYYLCKLFDPYCIIEKLDFLLSQTYKEFIDISLNIVNQMKKIFDIEIIKKHIVDLLA